MFKLTRILMLGSVLVLVATGEKNYYKILNIDEKSTTKDIKKAFRDLARKYHPDKNSAPGAYSRFTQIQEAYDVLKSPESRRRYDMSRLGHLGGRGRGPNAGGGGGAYGHPPGYKMNNAMKNKPFKFNFDSMFDDDDIFKDFGQHFGNFFKFSDDDFFGQAVPSKGREWRVGRGMKCKTVVSNVGGFKSSVTKCS